MARYLLANNVIASASMLLVKSTGLSFLNALLQQSAKYVSSLALFVDDAGKMQVFVQSFTFPRSLGEKMMSF